MFWGRQIQELSKHLDEVNGTSDEEMTLRLVKLMEEVGEVAEAWIGVRGQNPRKGVTHTHSDVIKELCDVAITALVLIQSFGWDAETNLIHNVNRVHKRGDKNDD